jgi:hypothetical protein
MPRIVVLLVLVLAAAGAALFLLLGGGASHDLDGAADREEALPAEGEDLTAPSLSGVEGSRRGAGRNRGPGEADPSQQGRPHPPTMPQAVPAEEGATHYTVTVLDAATGEGLANAIVWWEPPRSTCPRLPEGEPGVIARGPGKAGTLLATDATGRAAITERRMGTPGIPAFEIFASRAGYVTGVACATPWPGEVTVRLERGAALSGEVRDPRGQPVSDAVVNVRPGPETPAVPGYAGQAVSDDQGRFAVDGMKAGRVRVSVRREGFFPLELDAEDAGDTRPRSYVLTPAYVLRFRLRSDDGRPVVNPSARLVWGNPPREQLELLHVLGTEDSDGVLTQGIAMPASAGQVDVTVKAEGYAPWTLQAERVPPEGGERILPVTLLRDASQGGLRIAFEDANGQPVEYAKLGASSPQVLALDGQNVTSGVLIESGKELRFPALPAGRWQVIVRTHAHAPAVIEARVPGGGEAEARARLGPPARLRVRFLADAARLVRFRLVQGGREVVAVPEPGVLAPREDGGREELAAGSGGLLLGGLASGSYEIEILSDDLHASRTPVSLREGDTTEIEIRVRPR